jgi:hypothetical protein
MLCHRLLLFLFYQKGNGLMFVHLVSDLENGLSNSCEDRLDKSLDVFVSYRRSNGSQLARYVNGTEILVEIPWLLQN